MLSLHPFYYIFTFIIKYKITIVIESDVCLRNKGCCYCEPPGNVEGKNFCFNFKQSMTYMFSIVNELSYEECKCNNGYESKKRVGIIFFL